VSGSEQGRTSEAPPDWHDPSYLARGNPRQRRAHAALADLGILLDLSIFEATLVGSVPLAIDVPDSDLDIICRTFDLDRFGEKLALLYGGRPGFAVRREAAHVVAGFRHGRESIEVFGQDVRIDQQAGFRHMLVEWRLLSLGGERLRRSVVALKLRGFKTEPAFAAVLGLSGDPYQRLLELSRAGDAELAALAGAPGA
jgi:hypothetical protein